MRNLGSLNSSNTYADSRICDQRAIGCDEAVTLLNGVAGLTSCGPALPGFKKGSNQRSGVRDQESEIRGEWLVIRGWKGEISDQMLEGFLTSATTTLDYHFTSIILLTPWP